MTRSTFALGEHTFKNNTVEGQPIIRWMISKIIGRFENVSLLATCPNSKDVARATLRAAQEANAPAIFAVTLNQVDRGGGYTGFTPATLVEFLEKEAEYIGFEGPLLPCLDHGGPWLKDEHVIEGYDYEESMRAVKQSLEACLDAQYALLHIDPTVDRDIPEGEPIPINRVVQRTLELIAHAEEYREEQGLPPVSYEVGTEEVHGGLADTSVFIQFLEGLDEGLKRRGLEHAWPSFVVGKVGTDLHTSYFEPSVARNLTQRVRPYGALIKGHYTDSVDNPEDYPRSGMGGANVGPEFTEEEHGALMDLVMLERKIGKDSGLTKALRTAVVESGRWEKWLQPDEKGNSFEDLSADRQRWLVRTGSRYIWTKTDVKEARRRLYHNLQSYRNADEFVIWRIKTAILKYYHSFNLINFNDRLRKVLSDG